MIYKNGHLVLEIDYGQKGISAVYKGDILVWKASFKSRVKSCFGSGQWMSNLPWLDGDTWKNNN